MIKRLGGQEKFREVLLGKITESDGFVPSGKHILKGEGKEQRKGLFDSKEIFTYEYGFSKWLLDTLQAEGILDDLKKYFPDLWQFIVMMVYCRIAYKSALKNVPFHWEQSALADMTGWKEKLSDQKISDMLFSLGSRQASIHDCMKPKDNQRKTVLMDATAVTLQSDNISLAQKGYNADMNFELQFTVLYLYDPKTLQPLYYRLLPGNIREISALQNTVKISGMEQCVFIADKGFFSDANVAELERLGMQFIIPLKRDNSLIPYHSLDKIEQTDNYFDYSKRFIFHANTLKSGNRNIHLFLDGKLKEQEKTDYLSRIGSLPESYSKLKFNEKLHTMGTLALMHNTDLNAKETYYEYKTRCEIEQFFDHFKNTLFASSGMQREESLNGWMFINHLSMLVIYKLSFILKTTPLSKKKKLNHRYSINDTIEHLKSIRKIQYDPNNFVIAEINKATKTLLQ